jgi:arginase family enzyme
MQPSKVPGYLTCGDWVNSVVAHNKWLRKVLIIGVPEGKAQEVSDACRKKVQFVSRQQCNDLIAGHGHLDIEGDIYLSIDKDALSSDCAVTNWDQGEISLTDLKKLVFLFVSKESTIGIDVCGEFPVMKSLFEEERAAQVDNRANEAILQAAAVGLQSQRNHEHRKRCK